MGATVHFHAADTRHLFNIIGSADRDVLGMIGVHPGREFLSYEDDEELYSDDTENDDEGEEWDADEEEANAAREVLMKVIMDGVPHDLSEEEAYGIQDFFSGYAQQSEALQAIEIDDLTGEDDSIDPDSDLADEMRNLLLSGVDIDDLHEVHDHAREAEASADLLSRIQVLFRGRLPEADEPTFTDLETDAYGARFGYILSHEAALISDEIHEIAGGSENAVFRLLALLLSYSASQALDLVVTIED